MTIQLIEATSPGEFDTKVSLALVEGWTPTGDWLSLPGSRLVISMQSGDPDPTARFHLISVLDSVVFDKEVQRYVDDGWMTFGTVRHIDSRYVQAVIISTKQGEIAEQVARAEQAARDAGIQAQQAAEGAQEAGQSSEAARAQADIAAEKADQSSAGAQAATQASSTASQRATEAATARDAALQARDAAQAAVLTTGLWPDKATGLANTENGQSFSVAQGPDSDVAVITYLNDNGTAVETSRIVGSALVERVSLRVAESPEDLILFKAQNGIIGLFHTDATFEVISLLSGDIAAHAASIAELSSPVISVSDNTSVSEGVYPFALNATNGPVAAYFDDKFNFTVIDAQQILLGGKDIVDVFNTDTDKNVYPKSPVGILDGYDHIPYYGQSQVIGTTNGVIHNSPFDALTFMPAGGLRARGVTGYDPNVPAAQYYTSLVPIRDRFGETFIPGHAIQYRKFLTAQHPERNVSPVFTVAGQGGAQIAVLGKGTTAYNQFVAQWTGVINTIAGLGENYRCESLIWAQGGSDDGLGTNPDVWEASVNKLRSDLNADVLTATGIAVDPAWIVIQINNYMRYPVLNSKPNIGLKQYELATERDGFFGACPTYIMDFIDVAHWTKESQVKVGAYIEKVQRNILVEGGTWKPVHPVSIATSGDFSLVKFHLPEGGILEMDNTIVNGVGNYGFSATDAAGGDVPITRVKIVNADTVEIRYASRPPAGTVLRYGQTGQIGDPNAADGSGLGRRNGMRGNLRDNAGNDDTVTIGTEEYPLHNWCWMFTKDIGAK